MKFRKKPVEVDAIPFTGNFNDVFDWVSQWYQDDDGPGMWESDDGKALIVATAEGEMRGEIGDWIVKEPFPVNDREFYPCKPDIFEKTHEAVDQ